MTPQEAAAERPLMMPNLELPGDEKFLVLYGSHAHGTATPTSDKDWRGMYQVPTEVILGLQRPKDTYEIKADDVVMWELAQFVRLLLKGNPNLVGMLWTPEENIYWTEGVMAEILRNRELLLTEQMARAYHGWIIRELSDLGSKRTSKGYAIPGKRLSHVPRLIWELEGAITNRAIPVRLEGHRLATVMAIKTGEIEIEEAMGICGSLLMDLERLLQYSDPLPDAPFEKFNSIVLMAREGLFD